ncbi:MAG: PLP-dependent aminotransferase family protein [Bacteroidota bacterium]
MQIANEFIRLISSGRIAKGYKIPGSRQIASVLGVNRRTVIEAFEELSAQGWIEIRPNSGTFVNTKLPIREAQSLHDHPPSGLAKLSNFSLRDDLDFLEKYTPHNLKGIKYVIDTGYPDVRIGPMREITSTLNGLMKSKQGRKMMNYAADFLGDALLRKALVNYLKETRCINASPDNIMVTRGSLNAFFCMFQVLLNPGDAVIVGTVSFKVANKIIRLVGGRLITVPVDEEGLDVDEIEKICAQQEVKAVFVMPHHHHPTTVTLNAERRMKLLMLAQQYGFAIVEDDYDYDFHYARNPILPMASADQNGTVVYVGSFSKTVAPGLRTGFIVAPQNVISEVSRVSRFIDCHGNTALERVIAMLLDEGIIRRHLKKALGVYESRRDHFCDLLLHELNDYVHFTPPKGGLAVWVQFREDIPVKEIRDAALGSGLKISDTVFQDSNGKTINAIRMGFGSLNEEEMTEAVRILKAEIQSYLGRK